MLLVLENQMGFWKNQVDQKTEGLDYLEIVTDSCSTTL